MTKDVKPGIYIGLNAYEKPHEYTWLTSKPVYTDVGSCFTSLLITRLAFNVTCFIHPSSDLMYSSNKYIAMCIHRYMQVRI